MYYCLWELCYCLWELYYCLWELYYCLWEVYYCLWEVVQCSDKWSFQIVLKCSHSIVLLVIPQEMMSESLRPDWLRKTRRVRAEDAEATEEVPSFVVCPETKEARKQDASVRWWCSIVTVECNFCCQRMIMINYTSYHLSLYRDFIHFLSDCRISTRSGKFNTDRDTGADEFSGE